MSWWDGCARSSSGIFALPLPFKEETGTAAEGFGGLKSADFTGAEPLGGWTLKAAEEARTWLDVEGLNPDFTGAMDFGAEGAAGWGIREGATSLEGGFLVSTGFFSASTVILRFFDVSSS